MDDEELRTLYELNNNFKLIRNADLLICVTLSSSIGDVKISNRIVGNKILDLLIRETNESIKRKIE